jgi:GntR family transcriptional regulator / MocR family aminotransferase
MTIHNRCEAAGIDIWERLRSQALAQKGAHLLRHASSRGDVNLREAVASYLCDFGGARCDADQVLIVGGMQQAMLVSAMALLDPGEPVWIEDPGFHQALKVFTLAGAKLVPKPLDREGMVIARSPKQNRPKLIHVTPSHQYPLGMTMSFQRRTALLDLLALTMHLFLKTIFTRSFALPDRRFPVCRESTISAGSFTPEP